MGDGADEHDSLARLRLRQSLPPASDKQRGGLLVQLGTFGALGIGVISTDAAGFVVGMNSTAEILTGFTDDQARGKLLDVVFQISDNPDDAGWPLSVLSTESVRKPPRSSAEPEPHGAGMASDGHVYLHARDGRKRAVRYAIERSDGSDGPRLSVLIEDVTESRLTGLRLMHLSEHDPLTGLLTRQRFIRLMNQAIDSRAQTAKRISLVYVDIDRFRFVNDASGLEAGDTLLHWIAAMLKEAAGTGNAVGRLGGNEFGILLYGQGLGEAALTARILQRRLREFRFAWRESTFSVRSSVGVVEVTADFENASHLLGAAETASARARDQGGNRLSLWMPDQQVEDTARQRALDWVAHIKKNLQRGHVELFCQPIVSLLQPDAARSMEVLFRMLDAEGKPRGPQDILLTAERYGLMDAVDKFVVKHTLRQLQHEPRLLKGIDHWSINLSATSLKQETILDYIHDCFNQTQVPPSKICFEITETAAVENLAEVRWLMQELGSIGCRFSLDDFGSGMASYAYLRDLPVQYIKIDRSFVKDVVESELNSAIIESIHQIAALLGAHTIAEGVEDAESAAKLTALGLDYGQGYYFGRPGPITAP
ncbi:MAG: EAL domain-containing protein [Polyangiaceae bacterium]|nr:EAL domain-containing protein [Polyangiaceae bacterium]